MPEDNDIDPYQVFLYDPENEVTESMMNGLRAVPVVTRGSIHKDCWRFHGPRDA
jgi:hypothetical protein